MGQFTLTWDNTDIVSDLNSTGQRAAYRYKTLGGAFVTTGFTPSNDLAKSVTTADSPILDDNKVIEFKVQNLCTQNGPTDNDNGIQEVLQFNCLVPTITKTTTTSGISLNVTGLDITKAKFTLRKAVDNTLVGVPVVIDRISNTISVTATPIDSSTNYYWQVNLYATLNNVEVISDLCSPYPFTTDTIPVCNPVTAMTVASIEA
jgi:hypothetical protein